MSGGLQDSLVTVARVFCCVPAGSSLPARKLWESGLWQQWEMLLVGLDPTAHPHWAREGAPVKQRHPGLLHRP